MAQNVDPVHEAMWKEMERQNKCIIALTEEQMQLRTDSALIKGKSIAYGGLSGFLLGILGSLLTGALLYFLTK
jgi:hypothetical protein